MASIVVVLAVLERSDSWLWEGYYLKKLEENCRVMGLLITIFFIPHLSFISGIRTNLTLDPERNSYSNINGSMSYQRKLSEEVMKRPLIKN